MSEQSEFDNILEECLARALGGEPIEACLADHPGQAAGLEPLLRTALTTREAAAVTPRREFRERAALEFQAAIREMPARGAGRPVFWRRTWVGALAGVVLVLLVGTGLVAASNSSLPDQPLYGVKLATENAWLALTPSDLGKAKLYVKFTDRRVQEIIAMAGEGKTAQVDRATERLDNQLVAMAGLTAAENADMATSGSVPSRSLTAPATTATMTTTMATTTVPSVGAVPPPTTTTAPPVTITSAPAPTITVPPPPSAPPPVVITSIPGQGTVTTTLLPPSPESKQRYSQDGGEASEQARLRELLSRSAAANYMALLDELNKAPESMKPALEKALEVASQGYQQAIDNLD